MNPVLKYRIYQICSRWWMVLLCVLLGLLSVLPIMHAPPKYTATSTLVLSSMGRNNVDDATLVVGYSTLFNEPATIDRLRAGHDIPADVEFASRTLAASPILSIAATAKDATVAQDSAQKMAEAFRDDINAVRKDTIGKAIGDTQSQLDAMLARPPLPDRSLDPRVPILEQRMDSLRSDLTNQLQALQLRAGVTEVEANRAFAVATRIVGGLLVGVIAALGLAKMSTRLYGHADVLHKTGIEPLLEVPVGGSDKRDKVREGRLRTLANVVSLQDLPKSTVVAITDCRGAREAGELAEGLAKLAAQQQYPTVLVRADNVASHGVQEDGFNDVITNSGLVDGALKTGSVESLKVLSSGSAVADRYSLINRDRMTALVDELRKGADTIVIAAPSITESIDAQQICAAADFTIIVVGRGSSRVGDVRSAIDVLGRARATVLGIVLSHQNVRR